MFDSLTHLINAVLALTIFCDLVAVFIAMALGERRRLIKLLDIHIDIFTACAGTFVRIVKVFQRLSLEPSTKSGKPVESKQIPRPMP
jgi:hypothetical protein